MSEEVLTGENGDPIQDDGDNATGSEKDSDREDEEEETNAGEQWFRSLVKRALQRPEVSLAQLMHRFAVAKESAAAFIQAKRQFRAQCAADALAGTAKLRALLELTRTQLESKTHQCEAAMAQNRVYAAKYEGLERSYQQEKALREAHQQDSERVQGELAATKGELEQAQGAVSTLTSLVGQQQEQINGLKAEVGTYKGRVIASAVVKPDTFDGKGLLAAKGGQQVEDWFLSVQRYVNTLNLKGSDAVGIAATLLRGEAARAWSAHEAIMQASNKEISLQDVKMCMMQRFTPASTAWQARMDLDALQLGSKGCKTLAQYVTEFDRLCSLVPDLEPGEQKHRFRSGIQKAGNQQLFRQCCMDPTTSAPFDSYERMRAATLNCSLHAAEFAAHVSEAQTTLVLNQSKKRRFSDGGGHGSGGGKQQQQGGASSSGGGSSKQQQGGGGNDGGHKPKPKRPSRPTDVFAYCVKYKMCARCYGHHHSDDCTAEKSAQGKPPGFPKPPAWAKDKDASN